MEDEKNNIPGENRPPIDDDSPEAILERIRARLNADTTKEPVRPIPTESLRQRSAAPKTDRPRPEPPVRAETAAPETDPFRSDAPEPPPRPAAPVDRQGTPSSARSAAGQGQGRQPSSAGQGPAAYREYMHRANRPSVYPDAAAEDAYEAAYRDAMRKAAGEKPKGFDGNRARTAVGVLVLLFALFGVGCAVFFGVRGVTALKEKREQTLFAQYNQRLVSVAAVEPASFDDLSAASMDDLIKITIWSLIGSGFDPNRYTYVNGELCVPAANAAAAYTALFGTQRPMEHRTVEGYGYQFKYSEEDGAYFIPMTNLEPLYTPRVVSAETKGGATVVVCGLINSSAWTQDAVSGDMVAPEPDRYIRVTFRSASGLDYISAVQSMGLPETAIPASVPTTAQQQAEQPSEDAAAETTTEQRIVITWD